MVIGAFDFDGTLIKGDSFIRFGLYAVGRIRFFVAFIKAMPWLVAWKAGMVSSSLAKEAFFRFLFKGMSKEAFEHKGKLFASEIEKMLRHEIIEEMESIQKSGSEIIIATASLEDWVRPWAAIHHVDVVIATKAEVESNGRLTGRFSTLNCRGEEKSRRIKEYLSGRENNLGNDVFERYEIHAWGNIPDDKAMLDMADYPHVV